MFSFTRDRDRRSLRTAAAVSFSVTDDMREVPSTGTLLVHTTHLHHQQEQQEVEQEEVAAVEQEQDAGSDNGGGMMMDCPSSWAAQSQDDCNSTTRTRTRTIIPVLNWPILCARACERERECVSVCLCAVY